MFSKVKIIWSSVGGIANLFNIWLNRREWIFVSASALETGGEISYIIKLLETSMYTHERMRVRRQILSSFNLMGLLEESWGSPSVLGYTSEPLRQTHGTLMEISQ